MNHFSKQRCGSASHATVDTHIHIEYPSVAFLFALGAVSAPESRGGACTLFCKHLGPAACMLREEIALSCFCYVMLAPHFFRKHIPCILPGHPVWVAICMLRIGSGLVCVWYLEGPGQFRIMWIRETEPVGFEPAPCHVLCCGLAPCQSSGSSCFSFHSLSLCAHLLPVRAVTPVT